MCLALRTQEGEVSELRERRRLSFHEALPGDGADAGRTPTGIKQRLGYSEIQA